MMKFFRPSPPPFLSENYKTWGREYKAKREGNASASFYWKTYSGQRVNKLILQAFGLHADRCAFCDGGYPLGSSAQRTLEHFRPTSRYPRLAYVWHNLFVCCNCCQSAKGDRFDRRLLKPDTDDYSFERYFLANYRTGEIEINPMASDIDQYRAQLTIKFYELNDHGRPQSRLRGYRMYQDLIKDGKYQLDDFPYRFFLT
ncbi:MAG: hypothetical protein ACOYNY_23150 [Caldilineaceae bacterium]|jgi:uncharacterized protein (TIGR02646 family)